MIDGKQTILECFETAEDFDDVLTLAEDNAHLAWDVNFVNDLRKRFDRFGETMFLTDRQRDRMRRIAKV